MTLHVALVTDRTYLPWCGTAVLSLADHHAPGEVVAHVVHDGSLGPGDEELLRSLSPRVQVEVHRGDPGAVGHLPALDRFGRIVWLRFLLPTMLPDLDRVLYLDADTLVVGSLAALAELDMGGAPLGAVANVMPADDQRRVAALGLDPSRFFNSGVLLLDLAALREEDLAARVTEAATSLGDRLQWPDQDVLNLLFADRWHRLHPRFNAQNSLFDWAAAADATHGVEARRSALAEPAVLHFEGPYICKPWHSLSQHPWRDRYRAVLARTPWSSTGLEDDGPATRAIRRLPVAWQLPVYEQVVRRRDGKRPSLRGALRRRRAGSPAT